MLFAEANAVPWEAIATIVSTILGVTLAGLFAWIFRVDRKIGHIAHLCQRVDEMEKGNKARDAKIEKHTIQITRLEGAHRAS